MKQYEVEIIRAGYVTVEAESEADAIDLVASGVDANKIQWSDDWTATDATEV